MPILSVSCWHWHTRECGILRELYWSATAFSVRNLVISVSRVPEKLAKPKPLVDTSVKPSESQRKKYLALENRKRKINFSVL